ncbi:hypothetical protein [Paraburkholderia sp.]|uniref:hypothetical protein n=1 Tax=Paraburkholderia sp. TaxID=1926495 RepID=UPI0025F4029E|nr:hypothetical protein [Paraburkholderia sp.]
MNSQTQATSRRNSVAEAHRDPSSGQQDASRPATESAQSTETLGIGPAAAAIFAAGIGCFAIGLFALLGDAFKPVARFFIFYRPTGPLSGVTSSAIIVWLLSWLVLARRWQTRPVSLGRVAMLSFVLLALAVSLTFPPFMDLLQGK